LTVGARDSLREHWPEYLMEAWALGTFMVAAGVAATLLGSPMWPVRKTIPDEALRNVLAGISMGLTAVGIIHSPWGKQSGAHMNPAVTVAFLRLGKTHAWDALFYIVAQTLGGTLGVFLVAALLGAAFTHPPVTYAMTLPGPAGPLPAFIAELVISGALMFVLLAFAASARLAGFTGIAAGCLVALYISVESPLSGMSMNPARSFASAAPAGLWRHFWIYLSAPTLGMLIGAQLFLALRGARRLACAKWLHPGDTRCIHCGYEPSLT
jgi:aquaporin Z